MYMNHTNSTNDSPNSWEESSAMVYVALTVATFSAVVICCVWVFKEKYNKSYHTLHAAEETVELKRHKDDSSEDIPLDELDTGAELDAPAAKMADAFSLGDDEASDDEPNV